MKLTENMKT